MPIDREKITQVVNECVNILDGNTVGAKIGCYSVALIGFTVAVRRIRPFSRFIRPTDIPKQFIQKRQQLVGTVERIEPSNGLLLIKHKPLIPLPFSNKTLLPVKLTNVEVTRNGISWLQTIVVGTQVTFIPITVKKDWVQCEVTFTQLDNKKKLQNIDVGESLISIGFASLSNFEEKTLNLESKKYYKRLELAKLKAQRKTQGLSFYLRPFENFVMESVKRIRTSLSKRSPKLNVVA